MPDASLAAPFQNIQEAADIAVDIGTRVLERIADPRLGSQIDDIFELPGLEQILDTRPILKAAPNKGKTILPFQHSETRFFEGNVIVVIQVIEPGNLVPLPQQALRKVKADKSGSAGNKYLAHHSFLFRPMPVPARFDVKIAEIIDSS